jgi:hypothetical protein
MAIENAALVANEKSAPVATLSPSDETPRKSGR